MKSLLDAAPVAAGVTAPHDVGGRIICDRGDVVNSGADCVTPGPVEGRYANYFKVGYNAFEFVIDFGQLYPAGEPGDKEAQFHTRIITAPVYARALVETLQDSIEQYAQSFGEIHNEE